MSKINFLSSEPEWHRCKVKEAIYIKQQGLTMNCDIPPAAPHLQPDPFASTCIKSHASDATNAWSTLIKVGRNVDIRLKISLKSKFNL